MTTPAALAAVTAFIRTHVVRSPSNRLGIAAHVKVIAIIGAMIIQFIKRQALSK